MNCLTPAGYEWVVLTAAGRGAVSWGGLGDEHTINPVCLEHKSARCTSSEARKWEPWSQVNRPESTGAKEQLWGPALHSPGLGCQRVRWQASQESSLTFMVLCGLGKKINAGQGRDPFSQWPGQCSRCHGTRQSFQGGWMLLAPSHSAEVRKRPLSCPLATPRAADVWVPWQKHGAAGQSTWIPGPALPLNHGMM